MARLLSAYRRDLQQHSSPVHFTGASYTFVRGRLYATTAPVPIAVALSLSPSPGPAVNGIGPGSGSGLSADSEARRRVGRPASAELCA